MKVGDEVYVITDRKPVRGRIAAMRGDEISIDTGSELVWAIDGSDYSPVFATRLDALLHEAARLRKSAMAARREAQRKIDEAHEMEERALELLRDAQTQVRREAAQTA